MDSLVEENTEDSLNEISRNDLVSFTSTSNVPEWKMIHWLLLTTNKVILEQILITLMCYDERN